MTRLILVTFAALGWSFYVMSGGPDFEPRGTRAQQPERHASASVPAPKAPARAKDLVTNVAARTAPIRVSPAPAPEIVAASTTEPASLKSFSGFSAFDEQSTGFTLASLEDGATGLRQITTDAQDEVTQAVQPVDPPKDIREISGTRVNMRDGPGTIYPIIAKVSLGQTVEVLSDSGTGWLRLRVLPEQQIGWISASLVRKITN